MSDQNNPMKPAYEKPRIGGQTYRDKTAEEAIGRVDKAGRARRIPWGPEWRDD